MQGNAQAMADALDLGSRVTFHGFQPTDRLGGVLRSRPPSRGVVAPRGGGVVTLEAAASGLATVGTAVGCGGLAPAIAPSPVPTRDPVALGTGSPILLPAIDRDVNSLRRAHADGRSPTTPTGRPGSLSGYTGKSSVAFVGSSFSVRRSPFGVRRPQIGSSALQPRGRHTGRPYDDQFCNAL